jgi:hypothetical protein
MIQKTTLSSEIDLTYNTLTANPDLTIESGPKYAGRYQLGGSMGLQIYLAKKPKWLHRKMMKLCLGFEWINK